jgi:hypothetical protein
LVRNTYNKRSSLPILLFRSTSTPTLIVLLRGINGVGNYKLQMKELSGLRGVDVRKQDEQSTKIGP